MYQLSEYPEKIAASVAITCLPHTGVPRVSECDLGGGTGWNHYGPSIRIRDRLVHPRSVASLQVADSEWDGRKDGFVSLVETFDDLLTGISEVCKRRSR